jgi:hypothetical protein
LSGSRRLPSRATCPPPAFWSSGPAERLVDLVVAQVEVGAVLLEGVARFGLLQQKAYTKREHVPGPEAAVYNIRELRRCRSLDNSPEIITRLTGLLAGSGAVVARSWLPWRHIYALGGLATWPCLRRNSRKPSRLILVMEALRRARGPLTMISESSRIKPVEALVALVSPRQRQRDSTELELS